MFGPQFCLAQLERIDKDGTFEGAGQVVDIQPGEITIASDDGKQQSFIIQDADERGAPFGPDPLSVRRVVLLDSGPLGMVSHRGGVEEVDAAPGPGRSVARDRLTATTRRTGTDRTPIRT